jgi:hypothetical protein
MFDYKLNFLCFLNCFHPRLLVTSFLFVMVAIVSTGLLLFAFFRTRKKDHLFWIAIVMAVIFMQTPLSGFIWEHTFLAKVQFPYRMFVILDIALAYAAAAATASLDKKYLREVTATLVIVFIANLIAIYYWNLSVSTRSETKNIYAHTKFCVENGCAPQAFRPPTSKIREEISQPRPLYVVLNGSASIEAQRIYSRHWIFNVDAHSPVTFRFRQHMYPWWVAKNERDENVPITATGDAGEITFDLPQGKTRIDLRLVKNQYEIAGMIISMISVLITLMLLGIGYFHKRKTTEMR